MIIRKRKQVRRNEEMLEVFMFGIVAGNGTRISVPCAGFLESEERTGIKNVKKTNRKRCLPRVRRAI